MVWRGCSVLLLLLVLCFLTWSQAAGNNTYDLSAEEDRELERELQTLNKPFVKSFKDKYGITYDCVDIYNQPAFDHPLLKNHTLQVNYHLVPALMSFFIIISFLHPTISLPLSHEHASKTLLFLIHTELFL
ncbi:hypothetical protein B296_00049674 [Ensete ventricosum]|uniref:Neprosin activation peptide domain-containing protein n=1 Tax=Ensete ventricosum TaxID=4639 RepID=A0A426X1Z9_ENSVE|nr:hypothetical protein B296_00049674 [Ensete ventricosum]